MTKELYEQFKLNGGMFALAIDDMFMGNKIVLVDEERAYELAEAYICEQNPPLKGGIKITRKISYILLKLCYT